MRTLRAQVLVLYAIRMVGPSTSRELFQHLASVSADGLTYTRLQRFLTYLRRWELLATFPYRGPELLWALPGQSKPDRRREDRRTGVRPDPERRQAGSWWVTGSRAQFTEAWETRWR